MKTILIMIGVAAAVLLLIPAVPAGGAVDMFLHLEGVKGESRAKGYEGWIEVESFSWGVTNHVDLESGGGAGKASFSELSMGKRLDIASPELFLRVAQGKHFPTAELVLRSTGESPEPFFRITLSQVFVTGSQVEASVDEDRPTESVSLVYGEIEWEYTPRNPDGTTGEPVAAGWDLMSNTAK